MIFLCFSYDFPMVLRARSRQIAVFCLCDPTDLSATLCHVESNTGWKKRSSLDLDGGCNISKVKKPGRSVAFSFRFFGNIHG